MISSSEHVPAGDGDTGAAPYSRLGRVVTYSLAVILVATVALPLAQALARFGHRGIASATNWTQHLTLWIGFLGAVLATVSGHHLSLSTGNLLPAGRPRLAADMFRNALTSAIAALLTVAAIKLVLAERGSPEELTGGIKIWWSETVIPISLAIITLRFILGSPGGWVGRGLASAASLAAFGLARLPPELAAKLVLPGIVVLGVGFLLGVPVFAAMAGLTMLLYFGQGESIIAVPTSALQLAKNPSLPAVPLLTLAGYVFAAGGSSQRLVNAYRAVLGWLPGGLALMALSVCAVFTTFTGASGVTILAMGGIVLPLLLAEKYPKGFSVGLVTASGSLGLLFPPSLPVILYGLVLQQAAPPGTLPPDLKQLFVAGLVPGMLILTLVALYAVATGVRSHAPRHTFVPREAARALWHAKWDLLLPVIVVVGFGSGLTTLLETAALAAFYAALVEVVIFRNLNPLRDLPEAMGQAATLVGAVLILLGMAFGLNEYLVLQQFPDQLLEWVQAHIHSQTGFLLALNGILLVLGSVLEMYSAIVAIAPLVAPIGAAYQVDPIHLGVVFLANLELGFLLPPMGLNLFLSATRFKQPLNVVYRHAAPFLAIMTVGVLMVTYLPALTTGVLALLHMR